MWYLFWIWFQQPFSINLFIHEYQFFSLYLSVRKSYSPRHSGLLSHLPTLLNHRDIYQSLAYIMAALRQNLDEKQNIAS
ncbi:hypothetical protein XNC1_4138 [Xenorhabdus nematophila ATCC 19061]|uniref:Uncharacterized protein n=1 Tax=Xenorhabdus nematophila (strain ATCC 19061 / DSM 3370 / CCUG 14189 / LMG 1036 / NCIMB 9965 / AN6) TaxID=406817 RepID=D3VDC3_XENNA|nr:hypothetical protein XNC1_4138 [Xenorhabdus nematophila ATCC 19061]